MAAFSWDSIYRPKGFGGWVFSCALSHGVEHTMQLSSSSRRGEPRSQQRRANQTQWTFSVQVIILQEIMRVKRTCWIFSANISLSDKSFPGKLLPAELAA